MQESEPESRPKRLLLPVLFFLLLLVVPLPGCFAHAAQANDDVAILDGAGGAVEWLASGGAWAAVTNGQKIEAGTTIRTGADGQVWLSFPDGSKALVGPNAELRIVELTFDKADGYRLIRLEQFHGTSRHVVVPWDGQSARYEVNTPAGTSVTDNGMFAITTDGAAETQIAVADGLIQSVGPGQTVPITPGNMAAIGARNIPRMPDFIVFGTGTVEAIGSEWTIAGRQFVVNDNTMVRGTLYVGDEAYLEGYVRPDGTLVAVVISVTDKELEPPVSTDDVTIWTSTEMVDAGSAPAGDAGSDASDGAGQETDTGDTGDENDDAGQDSDTGNDDNGDAEDDTGDGDTSDTGNSGGGNDNAGNNSGGNGNNGNNHGNGHGNDNGHGGGSDHGNGNEKDADNGKGNGKGKGKT